LRELDGMVIPGGFGWRGIEGKIAAAGYAREHEIPCLGLCLGLHVMVIELARDVAGSAGANAAEFDSESPHRVIDLMDEQREVVDYGGTMRLGVYPAKLQPGSQVHAAYGESIVYERHRHRYEFNPRYHTRLEEAGLRCSGASPDDRLVEFIELPGHPFWGGALAPPACTSAAPRTPSPPSTSVTATPTSSPLVTTPAWRRQDCVARVPRPTTGWSSSSSCRAIHSGSGPRPTPSSRAAPTAPILSSETWWAPPWP